MRSAPIAFICKQLWTNDGKLPVKEKKWLKKIVEKSELLKNPHPQWGRK